VKPRVVIAGVPNRMPPAPRGSGSERVSGAHAGASENGSVGVAQRGAVYAQPVCISPQSHGQNITKCVSIILAYKKTAPHAN
jgi:hypothetical protein